MAGPTTFTVTSRSHLRGHGATRLLSGKTPRNAQQSAFAVDVIALSEWAWWYPYHFSTERGVLGLDEYRHDLAKLVWRFNSPTWNFSDATFDRAAAAFRNPDCVSIVIDNYRWRLGLAKGERRYDALERRLAAARPSGCRRSPLTDLTTRSPRRETARLIERNLRGNARTGPWPWDTMFHRKLRGPSQRLSQTSTDSDGGVARRVSVTAHGLGRARGMSVGRSPAEAPGLAG